jgi:hypothetical protein
VGGPAGTAGRGPDRPGGLGRRAFWNSPAVQARLAGLAGPVATQALGLGGPGALPPVAACCGLLALAVLAATSSATAPCDVQR